jgi:hypothetical protein
VSEPTGPLAHLTITGRAEDRGFHRSGGGDARVRDVERRAHGGKLRGDLESSSAKQTRIVWLSMMRS